MKVVTMKEPGGSEVLEVRDLPSPDPGPHDVIVGVKAAGVNFMDIGIRRGQFWTDIPNPKVLGVEGAGEVLAIGKGVDRVHVGQRVAWAYAPGSYAEYLRVPAKDLVPVPDDIDDLTAASLMMQGITASHFATEFYRVKRGDIALIHAAAGGVGQLLTQIVRLRGGQVIGCVSRSEKVHAARAAGADHVIVDQEGSFADEVRRLTGGQGVHVVYDGAGPKTFKDSLASLRRNGTFCWFGPVLGAPAPMDLPTLPRSIKIGYAVFFDHIPTSALLRSRARRLFRWVQERQITVSVGKSYSLSDVRLAHMDMESRRSTGKLLLTV
jgi:NADPH2:quinone reductase